MHGGETGGGLLLVATGRNAVVFACFEERQSLECLCFE
jgi:hypothetical protein